jgi:hypothetical protein
MDIQHDSELRSVLNPNAACEINGLVWPVSFVFNTANNIQNIRTWQVYTAVVRPPRIPEVPGLKSSQRLAVLSEDICTLPQSLQVNAGTTPWREPRQLTLFVVCRYAK